MNKLNGLICTYEHMYMASLTTVNLLLTLLSSKHNKSADLTPPPPRKLADFRLKQHMKQITGPDSDTTIDLLLPRKVEQSISTQVITY